MRHFINIILCEGMSQMDAERIFLKYGIDLKQSTEMVKRAVRQVQMKLHPDRGGNAEEMKLFNAACDVLRNANRTKQTQATPQPAPANDTAACSGAADHFMKTRAYEPGGRFSF